MARLFKQHDNSTVSTHLSEYWSFEYYKEVGDPKEVWVLDDILSGVSKCNLGGNTRPLRIGMLFQLLSGLTVISSSAVKEATKFSESHARKVTAVLRVASRAFANVLASSDSSNTLNNYDHLYKENQEDNV